ncbi:MAG: CAP domain-containing protein [Cyanobacteria bacterium P01_A01_bin.135]
MARDRAGNSFSKARRTTFTQGTATFRDAVSRSDRTDFYQFRLNRSSSLTASLSQLSADANITLFNQSRKVVSQAKRPGTQSETLTANLSPGTYFLRVKRRRGKTRYRLNLTSRPTADASGTFTPAAQTSLPSPQPLSPLLQGVLALTNNARRQLNLAPLRANTTLSQVAQQHSQNMATGDFFSHEDPSGRRPHERIAAANYGFRSTAENIAAGFSTAERVFQAWMDSPSHRVNILNPNLQEIGLGYAYLANDTGSINYNHYWTQVFAQPLS